MGHLVFALAALLAFRPAPPAEPDVQALIVTIVTPEPEPESPPQEAPPNEVAPAQPSAQPQVRYDVSTSVALPADALEVLTAPNADGAALVVVPSSVQQALARASDCTTRSERVEPRPACPPISDRLALSGPSSRAYLDETLLEEGRVVTVLKLAAAYIASSVVDDSIFEGRAGDPQAPESTWEINARANPLLVDQRIFDPESGEVTITRRD